MQSLERIPTRQRASKHGDPERIPIGLASLSSAKRFQTENKLRINLRRGQRLYVKRPKLLWMPGSMNKAWNR